MNDFVQIGAWVSDRSYAEIVSTLALAASAASFIVAFIANRKTNEGIFLRFYMAYFTHENMREYLCVTITNTSNRPVLISTVSLNMKTVNNNVATLAIFDNGQRATPYTLGSGEADVRYYRTGRGDIQFDDKSKVSASNLSEAIEQGLMYCSVTWGARGKSTRKKIKMKKV